MRILLIDADPGSLASIAAGLGPEGWEILSERNPETAFQTFLRLRPAVVLLDAATIFNSTELLEQMLEVDPAANVILASTECSAELSMEAIKRGACDFVTKPLDIDRLRRRVLSLRLEAEKRRETLDLDHKLLEACTFEEIVSRSPLMLEVFEKIRRVAQHFRTALITGDTGTGKELVARALHRLGPAAKNRFVACNCSALVESLVESELFGYLKGAFTGANQDRLGLFESADGGTLFLDEIGEMSLATQAKLLRILQDHQVRRVGAVLPRKVNLRVIAATNRNLRTMVQEGTFREDLYYRLALVEISLPRLEDRREDLPLLQRHFIEKFAVEYNRQIKGLTRRAQRLLSTYSWPGNIRELENVIGNACMMADGTFIDINDLPQRLRKSQRSHPPSDEELFSLEEAQRRHIVRVLERVGGNKLKAAKILGVGRNTIYKALSGLKLEKANLSAPSVRFGPSAIWSR